MSRLLLVAAAALAGCASESKLPEPDLCSAYENNIEKDMRILESDLTAKNAREASEWLEAGSADTSGLPFGWARLNSEKFVRGHELKEAARNEADPEKRKVKVAAFCTWLVKEGFYYD